MTINPTVMQFFQLVGGLVLFIYGMNQMADGLQKAAGERMRRILEVLTGNVVMGVLVGALVTGIMQSSSATTVLVVGLVSARLLSLKQAISIIIGANVGTTVTALIVSFKIDELAWPIAAVGFLIMMVVKKQQAKYFGQVIFYFGLLFVGLNEMSGSMKELVNDNAAAIEGFLTSLSDNKYLSFIVGTVLTCIVQSSSATIGIVQKLASTPLGDGSGYALTLIGAIPFLLGSNVGTTITAALACIGKKINAKRAALAHAAFNIIGSFVFMFIVGWYADFIKMLCPGEGEIIETQLFLAHFLFNLVNAIVWLPFVSVLAKLVTLIIPGDDEENPMKAIYLDTKLLTQPTTALNMATKEIVRMIEITREMLEGAKKAVVEQDKEIVEKVYQNEELINMLESKTVAYLSSILSKHELTERQSLRLSGLMHATNDVERIGDHCKNMTEFSETMADAGMQFSKDANEELIETFDLLKVMLEQVENALNLNDEENARLVLLQEDRVDSIETRLRARHMKRLHDKSCVPEATLHFVEIIHNLEKIGDHCTNIAETVLKDNMLS